MAVVVRIVNLVLLGLFVVYLVKADTYYLLDHCSDRINVHDKGEIKLEISVSDHISPPHDCEMYFEAPHEFQLKFYVDDIDLDDCFSGDFLQIFDETAIPSNAVSTQLCKDEGVAFKTTGNLCVISFHFAAPMSYRPASFRIYINLYSPTGDCGDDFFHCTNKDYCISNDLKCDDEDDCGDESDEKDCEGMKWWIILAICLGVGFAVIVIVAGVVVACVVNNDSKKKKVGRVHHQDTAPLSTVAASAPPEPWGFKTPQTPSVPPPSFTHTANQQANMDPPPSYRSSTQDTLPPLTVVPPPAVYDLPLHYQ